MAGEETRDKLRIVLEVLEAEGYAVYDIQCTTPKPRLVLEENMLTAVSDDSSVYALRVRKDGIRYRIGLLSRFERVLVEEANDGILSTSATADALQKLIERKLR